LSSLPGAPANLWLDFTAGTDVALTTGSHYNATFDQDGDPATFSTGELSAITTIWQKVAEAYAPFNLNVTTVRPDNLAPGVTLHEVIGGFAPTLNEGGVADEGAFLSGGEVQAYTGPGTAVAAVHEAGHGFGLLHQSTWSGATLVAEYSWGLPDGTAPFMGNNVFAARPMWWYGLDDQRLYQDDMAVIAANGFGYRPAVTGNSAATAEPLSVLGTSISTTGLIGNMSQLDYWSFSTGGGSVSFTVSAAPYSVLHPKFEIVDQSGNAVVGWQDPDSAHVAWSGTLAAGNYRIVIASHGISSAATVTNYGFDVGHYTVAGTVTPAASVVATPSDLNAAIVAGNQVNLTWSDNSNTEAGFKVEASPDGINWTLLTTTAADVTSYQVTGLSAGTYLYRVQATDAGGDSDFSNQVSVLLPFTPPPAAPSNLSVIALSADQVSLAWADNSNNETGFKVEASLDGVNWTLLTTTAANVTTYQGTLTNAANYIYRVQATNAGGDSTFSNQSSSVAPSVAAPSSLVATAVSGSEIDLSWTNNAANATGFNIQASRDGVNWTNAFSTSATSFAFTSLASSTTYYFRVDAFDATDVSYWSNVASATTAAAPPAAPSNLTATAVSNSQINLSWINNATNATGIIIEWTTNGTWSLLATTGPTVGSYQVTGLQAATTYSFRVRATNAVGDSANSNVAAATTGVTSSPPAAPTILTTTVVSSSEIDITWRDNSNDQSFFFARQSTDGVHFSNFFVSGTATSYQFTGLSAGTTYQFNLVAENGFGVSGPSNTVTATTLPAPPAAPSNLTAMAVSSAEIDLTWTNNSSTATGVKVESSLDGITWTLLTTTAGNVTSFQNTGLSASTAYQYRVRATNAAGDSANSNTASATTQAPATVAPAAPSNLTAAAASTSEIDLTWSDNSSSETGFKVESSLDGTTWNLLATTAANATSYQSTGLNPATTYQYRVRATNAAGDSANSNTASATTAQAVPAAPGNLTATAVSTSQINLTWSESSTNATGFKVEMSQNGSTWTLLTTTAAGVTSYQVTGLNTATTYQFRVRATSAVGDSANSSVVTATTLPVPPARPNYVYATGVSTSEIDLYWLNNATNQSGFKVERSLDGVNWTLDAVTAANATSFQDTGLTAGTIYVYRVRAFNAGGSSTASPVAASTVPTAPAAPTNLTVSAVSSSQINLAWTDNAAIETGYYVESSPDGVQWTRVATLPAHTTSYQQAGLNGATTYLFRVQATNTGGRSAYSSVASATTPVATAPAAPTSLTAVATDYGQITLSWTANPANVTGFKIERSTDGVTWVLVTTVANVTNYLDTPLDVATNYHYRVRATNAAGDSSTSNTASAFPVVTVPPAAPSNFVATAVSSSVIALTWTNNSTGATRIEESLDGVNWGIIIDVFTGILVFAPGVSSYSLSGFFNPSTTYYFRLRATNAAGDSANVVASAQTLAATAPAAPSDLTATLVSYSQINLSWIDVGAINEIAGSSPPSETGFKVEESQDGVHWTLLTTTAANVTSYLVPWLNAATTYQFRVRATNAGSDSASSNTVTATTPAFPYSGIHEFGLPQGNSYPFEVTASPDGNLYFTEATANRIGRISPTGTVTEFAIPTSSSNPLGIVTGPDGAIWFTQSNEIGRLDPTTGVITEFALPAGDNQPYGGFTVGPDHALWFTENARIGRLDPTTGAVTSFAVPTANAAILRIVTGPDGKLWFTEFNGNAIGTLDPTTGIVTEYQLPGTYRMPVGIAVGADGNLWFAEMDEGDTGGKIGRITTAGTITEFPTPTSWSLPQDIALGADGNLWFTEVGIGAVGRISTSGQITDFTTPSGPGYGIAAGPAGTVWFTENGPSKIGVFSVSDPAFVTPTASVTTVASSVGTAVFGQAVTFTATVQRTGILFDTPTGTVTFTIDGVAQAPLALTNGTATITTASLAVGAHTIVVTYNGDANFTSSTSASLTQTVAPAQTVTHVTSSLNPAAVGQTVTFTVSVSTLAPGSGTPTGSVAFYDGATLLGNGTLVNGVATFTRIFVAAGNYTVSAVYGGSTNYSSSSASLAETVTPTPSLGIQEFTLPHANTYPYGITAGPDGNVYFTEVMTNSIGRITPSGTVTQYAIPGSFTIPLGIITGPDGAIWFTQYNQIGRLNPTTGTITEYALPASDNYASGGITVGPDGAIWFTEDGRIGRLNPSTGAVTGYAVAASGAGIHRIVTGPDGKLWFTEFYGNAVGKLDPTTGTATVYPLLAPGRTPIGIVVGADGNLWFTEMDQSGTGGYMARVTLSGSITEFATPTHGSQPLDIALGADGNIWFTEFAAGAIGRISLTGQISEFATPTSGSGPYGITAGPSGTIWFTENRGNRVGMLSVSDPRFGPFTTVTSITTSDPAAVFDEVVVLTATVQPTGILTGTPTGTVTFTIDGGMQASATLVNGIAMLSVYGWAPGPHTITVTYNGDASFATSTASFTQNVALAPTVTTLAASVNPASVGQTVTFSATVSAVLPDSPPPTGTVAFYSGVSLLGYGTLTNGVATFTTSFAAAGSYALSAVYVGNVIYVGSSATLSEAVSAAAPIAADRSDTGAVIRPAVPMELGDSTVLCDATVSALASWTDDGPWQQIWLLDDDATDIMLAALANIPDAATVSDNADT
jgi:streptogramin lyase